MAYNNPGRRVGAPGNFAQSGRLGFAVGDPGFLDSEQSRVRAYWRGLEEGSTKFVGRTITGLWSNQGGPRGRLIGGYLSPFREGVGQKFVPFSRPNSLEEIGSWYLLGQRRALRYLHQMGADDPLRKNMVSGRIQKPIVAQAAYREAVGRFNPLEREKEAVKQVFGNMGFVSGGRNFATGRGGQTKTRFVDQRSRRPQPISSRGFVARTGFLTGSATSGYTASLVSIDRTFQSELTKINKLLADGLAAEVARIQKDKIKRPTVSTGRLVAATLNPKNRFPS